MKNADFLAQSATEDLLNIPAVNSNQVHIVESSLSSAELATFATSWVTAENMLERANVTKLDTVLVTGASGGVGSALVQLANRRGAVTVAMAAKDKHDQLEKLSPNAMIDRNSTDLKSAVGNAIGKHSVTVVADIVGGANWKNLIDLLAQGGCYTCGWRDRWPDRRIGSSHFVFA